MLAVVLASLAKLVVILKLGLRNISKRISSLIFLDIFTTTTCFDLCNSLSFKVIDKTNSKFDSKIKEALHINWRKLYITPFFLSFFEFFWLPLSSIIIIISETNYQYLLLSQLQFTITSSHCNTSCITPFPFIYYFHYI